MASRPRAFSSVATRLSTSASTTRRSSDTDRSGSLLEGLNGPPPSNGIVDLLIAHVVPVPQLLTPSWPICQLSCQLGRHSGAAVHGSTAESTRINLDVREARQIACCPTPTAEIRGDVFFFVLFTGEATA